MRTAMLGLLALIGCGTDSEFDLGVYTEFYGPDQITDQSVDLNGIDVLFSINTKVRCETGEPVSICVVTPRREWCSGSSCTPERYVDIALNFNDDDLPMDPERAYISGRITYCTGIWITAIR